MLFGVAYGQTVGEFRYDTTKFLKKGGRNHVIIENLIQVSDSASKPLVVGADGVIKRMTYWPGSAGSTPTFQQTLVAGSVLNQDNSITGGNHEFEILDASRLNFTDHGGGVIEMTGGNINTTGAINHTGNLEATGNITTLTGGHITADAYLSTNGSVTFGADLKPNNNAGTTGQVLKSQGPGVAPIWVDTTIASTPTLQQVIDAGNNLTKGDTVNVGSHSLNFISDGLHTKIAPGRFYAIAQGGNFLDVDFDDVTNSVTVFINDPSIGLALNPDGPNSVYLKTHGTLSLGDIDGNGKQNTIIVGTDSTLFTPPLGKINIDSLRSTVSMTGKQVMVRDSTGGGVYGIPASLIGGSNYWTASGNQIYNNNVGNVLVNTTSNTFTNGLGVSDSAKFVVKGINKASTSYSFAALDSNNRVTAKINNSGRVDQFDYSGVGAVHTLNNFFGAVGGNQLMGHYAFKGLNAAGNENTLAAFYGYITDFTTASMSSRLEWGFANAVNTTGGNQQPNAFMKLDASGLLVPYGVDIRGSGYTNSFIRTSSTGTGANFIFESPSYQWAAGLRDDVGTGTYALVDNTAGQFRFQISSAGAIRFNAYGAGAITSDASGNLTSVSDERLKTNINYSRVGLKELMQLRPINYKWNKKSGNETEHTYTGFSAQNVKANIPNGTGENKDGYLSLQDRAILAAAVNAIQDLKKIIDAQQKEIDVLKRQPRLSGSTLIGN
jgi:hypothetical protein